MHNFLVEQPDLNFHNRAVQDALLDTCSFWLERGVDGFRLDTVNFYFHSQGLESNPPTRRDHNSPEAPAVNPYNYQDHIYDKSQPENLGFLQRLRALLDRYPAKTTVGEIGDGPRSLKTMAAYTSGGDKLHMCYTFDFLSPIFTRRAFPRADRGLRGDRRRRLAVLGLLQPRHRAPRQPLGGRDSLDPDRLARLAAGILLSLRGSVCLYQGEELGLTEAELRFEDLADPYGIRFWPEYKGRDGCRTPMVWESNAPNGGFTAGQALAAGLARAHVASAANREAGDPDSMLAHYRRLLAFRRAHPALRDGTIELLDAPADVLAFMREGERRAASSALFNFGVAPARFALPAVSRRLRSAGHGFAGDARAGRPHRSARRRRRLLRRDAREREERKHGRASAQAGSGSPSARSTSSRASISTSSRASSSSSSVRRAAASRRCCA